LTNDKELKKLIQDKKAYNVVDSSVIAPLLTKFQKDTDDEIIAIKKTCTILKGTFGLWMYNQRSNSIYIARSGSTLFADYLNNMFSSIKFDDFVALDEGVIYLLTAEGITSVGKFAPNSPFFTP
jgi:glucosamine 6-phosphate synthetase-like amidotransferase/phosphosugar isomerase protein